MLVSLPFGRPGKWKRTSMLIYKRFLASSVLIRLSLISESMISTHKTRQNRVHNRYEDNILQISSLTKPTKKLDFLNLAYDNLELVEIDKDTLRNLEAACSSPTFTTMNPFYGDWEIGPLQHHYDEPSLLVPCRSSWTSESAGPRKKANMLYKNAEMKKNAHKSWKNRQCISNFIAGDSCLSRLILFLILMVSLTSLALVVLVILGELRPSCCKEIQGENFSTLTRKAKAFTSQPICLFLCFAGCFISVFFK